MHICWWQMVEMLVEMCPPVMASEVDGRYGPQVSNSGAKQRTPWWISLSVDNVLVGSPATDPLGIPEVYYEYSHSSYLKRNHCV